MFAPRNERAMIASLILFDRPIGKENNPALEISYPDKLQVRVVLMPFIIDVPSPKITGSNMI